MLFTIENQEFGWDEIVIAAQVWGEWQPFVETVRQSLACLRLASKTDQMPHAREMRKATASFRYAHNLISADDTKVWFARWQITVEEWMNYLRGQLLRERWATNLNEIIAANPVSDREVSEVIKNHAVCADRLGEWAIRLAERTAVVAKSGRFDLSKRRAFMPTRELVLNIEAEFERERKQAVTPELVETKIADNRLEWIRFDCRYLWFAEERIAREAAFCITEDGLTMDDVARDARGVVQQSNFYLDEIEESARSHFLAARQGDWLGPVRMMEGFPLFSIVAKIMPAADDPNILERAEQSIIASLMRQAVSERVQWTTLD